MEAFKKIKTSAFYNECNKCSKVMEASKDYKVCNECGKHVHGKCALASSLKGAHFCSEIYKNSVVK